MHDIRYDAATSQTIVRDIAAANESGGVNVLFVGADRDAMKDAVSQLADFTGLNVHQINVSGLIGDRENQTRGNVRETFDNAKETGAILVLEHAGELFSDVVARQGAGDLDDDARTGLDYLFQRIKAFVGICILQINDADFVDDALEHDTHFVIRF